MTSPVPRRPVPAPLRQRLALRWRLRRAWRQGIAARKAIVLTEIHSTLLGAAPSRVDYRGGLTDVVFPGGTAVRLGPCHRPAVRALRAALAGGGPVYLAQASDHGRCWGLYFASPAGRLALIALELRLVRDGGGSDAPEPPTVPASPLRARPFASVG